MATVKHFEDLRIWQESRELVKEIYGVTIGLKDAGLKGQITRAAVSVMSNIAEGFDRESKRDFARYLKISKSSLAEVRSLLFVLEDIQYIFADKAIEIRNRCYGLANGIAAMIKYLNSQSTV